MNRRRSLALTLVGALASAGLGSLLTTPTGCMLAESTANRDVDAAAGGARDASAADEGMAPPFDFGDARGDDFGSADVVRDSGDPGTEVVARCPVLPGSQGGNAPIRRLGGFTCVPVGAHFDRASTAFPAVPAAVVGRVAYVRAADMSGAAEDGDGSQESPFRYPESALAAGFSTLLLARGTHNVPRPGMHATRFVIDREVRIVGAGVNAGTLLVNAAGERLFEVRAGGDLQLEGVVLRVAAGGAAAAAAMVSARDGARVRLENALLEQGNDAVEASGAGTRVALERVTVRGSSRSALRGSAGAQFTLRGVELAATSGPAVFADGASLALSESYVHDTIGPAIVLANASPLMDRLDRVVVHGAVGVAVRIEGPGRTVEAALLDVSNTGSLSDDAPGLGVLVRGGAALRVDDGVEAPENLQLTPDAGAGSVFASNAGGALLASGAGTTVSVRGASFLRNRGFGMAVQRQAACAEVAASRFEATEGVGLLVTAGGTIAGILDDSFRGGTLGAPPFESGPPLPLAVGALLQTARPGASVGILDDSFHGNAQLDLLLLNTNARLNVALTEPGGAARLRRSSTSMVTGNAASEVSILDDSFFPGVTMPATAFGALREPAALR